MTDIKSLMQQCYQIKQKNRLTLSQLTEENLKDAEIGLLFNVKWARKQVEYEYRKEGDCFDESRGYMQSRRCTNIFYNLKQF